MSFATLQDLCLKVIVSKFKWYCEVYCLTEDSCLKLKFEFLKKKFSFLILQKLKAKGRIEPEWLDFLINKYLKVLDAEWLTPWPWKTVCDRLSEIGTNLEKATFSHAHRPWKKVLRYLPNLKSVSFREFCTDKFLLSLSKFCKCVETLDIRYSYKVSDNGLTHLCCKDNNKNLYSLHAPIKELLACGTNVRDEGVAKVLKSIPSLEKIDYRNLFEVLFSMHKSDINAFDKVKPYNLTHLVLYSIPLSTNVFTVCTLLCPHLKSLSFYILEKQNLDNICSGLQELEELQLDCTAEVPLELHELLTLNGKKLSSLRIRSHKYPSYLSLSILAQNCPKLTTLFMDRVILQYDCNDSVPVFHNLVKVHMHIVITEAAICLLSSAPNLKELCFYYCDLRSSDIKIQIIRCCEQCELNVIEFNGSDVEFELVRDALLACSTLQTLKLDDCDIIKNSDAMHELQTLSTSLPNKPHISGKRLWEMHGVYNLNY